MVKLIFTYTLVRLIYNSTFYKFIIGCLQNNLKIWCSIMYISSTWINSASSYSKFILQLLQLCLHYITVQSYSHRHNLSLSFDLFSSWEKPAAGVQALGWLPEFPSARGDWPQLQRNHHHLQEEVPWRWPPHFSWLQPAAQTARHQGETVCYHFGEIFRFV